MAEFLDLIGPLTDPRAHGGDPTDAFHVVIPSLPGFGFSTPLASAGWELARTTEAFAELMHRLGYAKFAAQGGDIGAGVTGRLAANHPERVIATHVNSDQGTLGLVGEQLPIPDGLTEDELAALEVARERWAHTPPRGATFGGVTANRSPVGCPRRCAGLPFRYDMERDEPEQVRPADHLQEGRDAGRHAGVGGSRR
ncbi:alpha/beta fold hydrolase [Nocardia abscessus]|uniref:alpha/beta fold hydrolase n=1 Tax=Nocardia abscessus TaxID=120957 RepID=UPI0024584644|nr:alpha/beta fold hydrolase [Nocardia abscessus]